MALVTMAKISGVYRHKLIYLWAFVAVAVIVAIAVGVWATNRDNPPKGTKTVGEAVAGGVVQEDMPAQVNGDIKADDSTDANRVTSLAKALGIPLAKAASRLMVGETIAALKAEGLLPEEASEQQTVEALHALIAETPSVLLGVALADAVGEQRTQNQPGTNDEYPNWRIPLADADVQAVLVEDLAGSERFSSLVRALGPAVPSASRG